jgi:deazaflavin-dependent oxidoreductase (nitroreductase family)
MTNDTADDATGPSAPLRFRDADHLAEVTRSVVAEFRANGGRLTGPFAGHRVALVTHVDADTGEAVTSPLTYAIDGDRLVLVASNGGARRDPSWYRNLIARSSATVELPGETFTARVVEATGEERRRLFDAVATEIPAFREYDARATARDRVIPVLVLERLDSPSGQ